MKQHKPLPNEALEFWLWILGTIAFFCVCYVAILYMNIKDAEADKITPTSQAPQNSESMGNEPPTIPGASARERLSGTTLGKEQVEVRRKAKWKATFPWKPTREPKLNHFAQKYLVEAYKPDSNLRASKEESAAGGNHYTLKNFFADEARFSRQFQHVWQILDEHGRGHNPVLVAAIFRELLLYKHAVKNDDWSRHPEWYEPVLGNLEAWEWLRPEFMTEEGQEEARSTRDRLIHEVPGMEELDPSTMDYALEAGINRYGEEAKGLIAGEEEMLTPYEGWYQQAKDYWDEQRYQFARALEEGDPSLKQLRPDLFPPTGIENGVLVDKNGDPIRYHEGSEIVMVTPDREVIPLLVNEDDSIRLPTPEEIEQLRAEGEVRQLPDTPPGEAILGIDPYLANPNSVEPAMDQLND